MKYIYTLTIITLLLNVSRAQHLEIEGRIKVDTVLQSTNGNKVLIHEEDNTVTQIPISNFDTSQVNEIQLLSVIGDTIFISNGNYIVLPGLRYLSKLLPPVQTRLDNGETPCQIINSGVIIDSLYGKSYMGGLIFNLDSSTCETLIALSIDLSQEEWGCKGQDIFGANNENIGAGFNNTVSIVSNCNESSYAAKSSWHLDNGYSDWFLPSRLELESIYHNLFSKGHGSYANFGHWASTQNSTDPNKAWSVYFENGGSNAAAEKDVLHYVIPIRKQ